MLKTITAQLIIKLLVLIDSNDLNDKMRNLSALAQLVEQMTVNHWVAGSSPAGGEISHRGPDGQNIWISDHNEFPVQFGHARLANTRLLGEWQTTFSFER